MVRHFVQIALYGCIAIALAGAGAGMALEPAPSAHPPALMAAVASLQQDPQAVADAIVRDSGAGR